MKLRCHLHWHDWKRWIMTPASATTNSTFIAGQTRQCRDCWLIETRIFPKTSFNMRPLRQAIREHIKDLEESVVVIAESEFSEEFARTSSAISESITTLSKALETDEGRCARISEPHNLDE